MNSLIDAANDWVGKDFRPGVPAMCMGFVRQLLHQTNNPLADVITAKAVDGEESGYWLASSLAGRDLGELVDKPEDLSSPSIVFFEDTYSGPWPPGTITHVGVYVGGGFMVHRPTMDRHVEKANILSGFWRDKFRCGLVLDAHQVATLPEGHPVKLFLNQGHTLALVEGKQVAALDVRFVRKADGTCHYWRDGKEIKAKSVSLMVLES